MACRQRDAQSVRQHYPLLAELEAALRDPSGASWEAALDDAVKELGELGAIEAIPLLLRICDATDVFRL